MLLLMWLTSDNSKLNIKFLLNLKNYKESYHENHINFFVHSLVPSGIETKSVKVNPSLKSFLLVFMSHSFITNLYTKNDVWFCFDMSEYWLNYAWKKKYFLRQFTFLCKINYMTLKKINQNSVWVLIWTNEAAHEFLAIRLHGTLIFLLLC